MSFRHCWIRLKVNHQDSVSPPHNSALLWLLRFSHEGKVSSMILVLVILGEETHSSSQDPNQASKKLLLASQTYLLFMPACVLCFPMSGGGGAMCLTALEGGERSF